jgi:hypothetical protein
MVLQKASPDPGVAGTIEAFGVEEIRKWKSETKMLNPKLETINSK